MLFDFCKVHIDIILGCVIRRHPTNFMAGALVFLGMEAVLITTDGS